ncbi:hypothetical protein BJ508DRAFT_357788 [Ascobolus immersus RN42]|uniref:DUF1770-domain-containing protein n=1 Tax=Ascobolus immersus RN42 TaxID=1160509 RepID=A0A3N4IMM1_ASCIM|nr:hypothetical protein BJ508DRAFT_357788 [Ascobolus immersus RN42]
MSDIPLVAAEAVAQDATIPEHHEPRVQHHDEESTTHPFTRPSHLNRSPSVSSFSSSILYPERRSKRTRVQHPPLPDLRFEQSYLRSIQAADGDWKKIVWITIRDQVFYTFAQGLFVALGWAWWGKWRNGAKKSGRESGQAVKGLFTRLAEIFRRK